MKSISISDSRVVFGKNECIYQCVLDDFKNIHELKSIDVV